MGGTGGGMGAGHTSGTSAGDHASRPHAGRAVWGVSLTQPICVARIILFSGMKAYLLCRHAVTVFTSPYPPKRTQKRPFLTFSMLVGKGWGVGLVKPMDLFSENVSKCKNKMRRILAY